MIEEMTSEMTRVKEKTSSEMTIARVKESLNKERQRVKHMYLEEELVIIYYML